MLKKIKQRMSEAEKVVQVEGVAVKNAWNNMAVFWLEQGQYRSHNMKRK